VSWSHCRQLLRTVANALDKPVLDTIAQRLRNRELVDLRAIAEKSPFYRVRRPRMRV
jgi:hypothetical protein